MPNTQRHSPGIHISLQNISITTTIFNKNDKKTGKRKGPTRNRTGVARMSYTIGVMLIRTGSDNRYTIEPIGIVLIDGEEAAKDDHIAKAGRRVFANQPVSSCYHLNGSKMDGTLVPRPDMPGRFVLRAVLSLERSKHVDLEIVGIGSCV
jgi:hypothetical protein